MSGNCEIELKLAASIMNTDLKADVKKYILHRGMEQKSAGRGIFRQLADW